MVKLVICKSGMKKQRHIFIWIMREEIKYVIKLHGMYFVMKGNKE